MMQRQRGFTLVEIAIVMVIIGVLLGGVLKGQQIVENAKIKNLIGDFNGIKVAYISYKDRFHALPGDDQRANWRFSSSTPGDGNGGLAQGVAFGCTASNTSSENCLFWQHLRAAGFLQTSGSGLDASNPKNAFGGSFGVRQGASGILDAANGYPGPMLCAGNVPGYAAAALDSQLDDGDARAGLIRATLGTNDTEPGSLSNNVYVADSSAYYTVCLALQ